MLRLFRNPGRTNRPAALFVALVLAAPTRAWAGPPFLTDDPEPTETGHWEIYGPLIEGEGRGAEYDGSAGAEINYGPARNVQLTIGLPIAFAHDRGGMDWGAGVVAVSVKFRVVHAEDAGLSIAVFPGMSLRAPAMPWAMARRPDSSRSGRRRTGAHGRSLAVAAMRFSPPRAGAIIESAALP